MKLALIVKRKKEKACPYKDHNRVPGQNGDKLKRRQVITATNICLYTL